METFDVDLLAFSPDFDFFCHPGLIANWNGGDSTEQQSQIRTAGPTSQVLKQDQEGEDRGRDSTVTDDDEQEDLLPVERRAHRKQLFVRKRIEELEKRDL